MFVRMICFIILLILLCFNRST